MDGNRYFTWKVDTTEGVVVFNATFDRGGWLGLGLTKKGSSMVGADIMLLQDLGDGRVTGTDTWSEDYVLPKPDPDGSNNVQVLSLAYVDSQIVNVVFSRPLKAVSSKYDMEFLEDSSTMIAAWGMNPIAFHGPNRRKMTLCSGGGGSLLTEGDLDLAHMRMFHGVLMGCSWGVTLSIGRMNIRY